MEDDRYEEHLMEERRSLLFAFLEQARSFDRWILTLAGGTFGLSLAFINQIAPDPKTGTIRFLLASWGFFAASITSTLVSFLLSQETCYRQIQSIHRLLKDEIDSSEELPPGKFGRITKALNYTSIGLFLLGIVFLVSFAALNLVSAEGA